MKKLLAISLLSLSFGAFGADNFNTLDTAPSVTVSSALPTGTNVIGKVGIDQTTPGTTNAVQANAGTNLNTSALALDASVTATTGSKTAGTAAASSVLGGGVYNSALPAPSTGQQTALQVDSSGRLRVVASEVASGSADSGNTVKVGGKYNLTVPTFSDGQRADLQQDLSGNLRVRVLGTNAVASDGASNTITYFMGSADGSTTARPVSTANFAFNGSTWDRIRAAVITPSATLIGHQNSLPWAIYNATPTVRTEGQGGPLQADVDGKLHVVSKATPGTMTDRSGTITSGGAAQTIMSANANRKYLLIQNSSDTVMWCNFTTTAVASQPSFTLIAGASFVMENNAVSTEAISCISATTGKIFTAKEM